MKVKADIYESGKFIGSRDVEISVEREFEFYLNGKKFTRLSASPRDIEELSVGLLITHGLIDFDRADSVDVKIMGDRVDINAEVTGKKEPKKIESGKEFKAEVIFNSIEILNNMSKEWKKTGGTHNSCIISDKGKGTKCFEDIGRHNSLDKIIGWSAINKIDLNNKFLLFSGRFSSEIVRKVLYAGIPLAVSKSAPLSSGIELAERMGLTIVGFARYPRFSVYTNSWRIIH